MTATTTTAGTADDREPESALAAPEIQEWRGVSAEDTDDISDRGTVFLRRRRPEVLLTSEQVLTASRRSPFP